MSIPVPKGTQGVAPTAQTREEATLLMLTRLEECGLVEGSQFRGLGSHELLSLGSAGRLNDGFMDTKCHQQHRKPVFKVVDDQSYVVSSSDSTEEQTRSATTTSKWSEPRGTTNKPAAGTDTRACSRTRVSWQKPSNSSKRRMLVRRLLLKMGKKTKKSLIKTQVHTKRRPTFVTMSDIADLLKQEREKNPKEPRLFGSALVHISKFVDSMGAYAGNEEKITLVNLHTTKQASGEDLLRYIHRFRDISLDCYANYEEGELVGVCIDNMLPEFRAHLENLDISRFGQLLQKARKTALSVKPHTEKPKEKKNPPQVLTVSTVNNKRKKSNERSFDEAPPPVPCTLEEMKAYS
uniref:Retrotransposon gag domain-containing protein n=1 Tax=Fagus sylvatica TaxID=28930 RepID=A0A2N9H229_FAGSY